MVFGLGGHLVAAGDLADGQAVLGFLIFGHQFVEQALHFVDGLLNGRRDLLECERLVGNVDDRLEHGANVELGVQRRLDANLDVVEINEDGNLVKAVTAYYLLISIITGLRKGEQLQLRWCDIGWMEKHVKGGEEDDSYFLQQQQLHIP